MTLQIEKLTALQVLDSRGNPTLEVQAVLSDGTSAQAMVPSGASTGKHEALELRDGEEGGYGGRSVLRACAHVEGAIAAELKGLSAESQEAIDERLIALDGVPGKSRLGANAILGVSTAVARAVAQSRRQPLWEYLQGERQAAMPVPMINILSGGIHAGKQIEFQDFLIVPHGFDRFADALEAAVQVHRQAGGLLRVDGFVLTGVADEGGWGPLLSSHQQALDYLMRAIEAAGYEPGEEISFALDVAASHFHSDGVYELRSERRKLTSGEMGDLLEGWVNRYPILSIEDALAEDDWEGWQQLTGRLGRRCLLVGDDLFVTNSERLERGIGSGAANAVLVKMNQIGTLTETLRVVDRAGEAGYAAVISARSGETEDDFLSDLAVASGSGQIKVGSITRSERLAKYNRLLRIEASEAARDGRVRSFRATSEQLFSKYWKT